MKISEFSHVCIYEYKYVLHIHIPISVKKYIRKLQHHLDCFKLVFLPERTILIFSPDLLTSLEIHINRIM